MNRPGSRRFGTRSLRISLALLTLLSLLQCRGSSGPTNPIRTAEDKLGTGNHLNWSFHQVVEDPAGLGMRFPGYLIGIEKTDRDLLGVGLPGEKIRPVVEKPAAWEEEAREGDEQAKRNVGRRERKLRRVLDDGKRTFISHLVAYDAEQNPIPHTRARFLHNAYNIVSGQEEYSEVWNNPTADQHGHLEFPPYNRKETLYANSWQALDKLRQDIEHRLATGTPITHVFLFSMGWNTPEIEAIQNYNSLFGNLIDQASQDPSQSFKPVFIGLSWPSQWTYPAISYFNKANDADEIGLIWANELVNDILLPLKKKYGFRVVLVGHSFGARLISRAAFSGPVLDLRPEEKVDLLILLQGAVSVNRFLADRRWGQEGAPYAEPSRRVGKVVLTWSRYDTANPIANWVTGANNAGGEPGFERASAYKDVFETTTWTESPEWDCGSCGGDKVLMVNASDLVRFSTFEKGGEAHSDIYHPKMGGFLWKLTKKFAPGPVTSSPVPSPPGAVHP